MRLTPLSMPLLLLMFLACSPALRAAPPPQAQQAVDRAVADYEAGRLGPARSAFELLARRHVPAAEYNLAVMHMRGEMPRSSPAQARRLLERAAASGFVTAQLALGRGLENGELGPRNLALALQWYVRAAEGGNLEAQVEAGTAYYLGRGQARDAERATHWYREAAKRGDIGAMYLLASMYEQGDGVERDLRLARYWYAAAAGGGDEAAPDKLREIDARLAGIPS